VGDGHDDQDDEEPVASSTSDATSGTRVAQRCTCVPLRRHGAMLSSDAKARLAGRA
jgi:hypothetical protein